MGKQHQVWVLFKRQHTGDLEDAWDFRTIFERNEKTPYVYFQGEKYKLRYYGRVNGEVAFITVESEKGR